MRTFDTKNDCRGSRAPPNSKGEVRIGGSDLEQHGQNRSIFSCSSELLARRWGRY
jgi:hypothetical protein